MLILPPGVELIIRLRLMLLSVLQLIQQLSYCHPFRHDGPALIVSLVQLNNAGFASGSGLLKDSQDDFDKVFSTNVRGLYFTAQAVAKLMVDNGIKGRIINTSSIAGGELVQQGMAIYAASKAAVIQLTRYGSPARLCQRPSPIGR